MEDQIIMVDTSVLIDFYRKTDKNNSVWLSLIRRKFSFVISVITKYEIYAGATGSQLEFWDTVLQSVKVMPLDETCVNSAVSVNTLLKKKRKQIDFADLLIASTAIANDLPLATLNIKHFERIENLQLVSLHPAVK